MNLSRFLHRRQALLWFDVALIMASYAGAFFLRLGGEGWATHGDVILKTAPVLAVLTVVTFSWLGIYRSFARFAGIDIALKIFQGVTAANLLFLACLFLVYRAERFPRGVFVINWMANILATGGPRLAWRIFIQSLAGRASGHGVVVYGSVEESESLLREFAKGKLSGYWPVGLVDPDPSRQGRRIHGVPILGGPGAIDEAVRNPQVDEIHFVGQLPDREILQRFLDAAEDRNIRFRTIPSVSGAMAGEALLAQARDLRIEDLLKRDPKDLDLTGVRHFIEGRTVLVTGAGGSIGSELVFQIAANLPEFLVLVDFGEENLHRVRLEARRRFPQLMLQDYLADVADFCSMERVFREHRPELVFHAAAYKHVHLVEMNPCQGIVNNVEGLRVVAELAVRDEVPAFVFISTDKAAQPVSLMGATKRLGECFIRNLNSAGGCKFVSVRFGNVLGSSGSVVPVFQEQILAGGPVTVTDPRMTRYFMLPSEAVQLVLQAASLGEGGKTYVLDMGEPVSIEQLARDMIRLLGHVPDRDIRIVHTGIRPGEKLHEELYFPGHQQETRFSGTWEDNYVPPNALPATSENLRRLVALARKGKASEALRLLKELVPDFEPMYPETRQLLSSREAP